jgi:hypothetical protein
MSVLKAVKEAFDRAVIKGVYCDDLVVRKNDTNWNRYVVCVTFVE